MAVSNRIPLLLPEHVILKGINMILQIIREDHAYHTENGTIEESLLHLFLNNEKVGIIDIYKEAVKIFATTPEDPKHFNAKLSFDKNTQRAPSIFITQPSESTINNSIGIGEGDQDELIITHVGEAGMYKKQFMRRYSTTHYVVIVCENRTEGSIIYNVIKAMIASCIEHFELSGLSNLKLSGQELKMRSDVPDALFQKAIIMSFEYEQVSPSIVVNRIYDRIKLYWRPTEAVTSQGPILIPEDAIENSASS